MLENITDQFKNYIKNYWSIENLVLMCFILCFLPSAYLLKISKLIEYAYKIIRLLISVYFFYKWYKTDFNKSTIEIVIIIGIYSAFVICTYFFGSKSYILSLIQNLIYATGFCIMIDYYMHYNALLLITAFRRALELLVIINFCTVLYSPSGLYTMDNGFETNPAFFLGHKNNAIESMIPLIGLSLLEEYIYKRKIPIHSILLIIISSITVVATWSINAVLCLLVFDFYIILILLKLNRIITKLINARLFAFLSALLSFLLIVVKIADKLSFILKIFHKDSNLSGRAYIWEKSVYYIQKALFTGYGVELESIKASKIYMLNSCHNYFLDFLYYGGVGLLILVVILFIRTTRKHKISSNSLGTDSTVLEHINEITAITIGAYGLLWVATPIHRTSLCWMFGFWFVMLGLNKYFEKNRDIICSRY